MLFDSRMVALFHTELRNKLIGFLRDVVQNPRALFENCRILRVFFAKLFSSGVVEKTAAFAQMRRDQLITERLIVRHCCEPGTGGGVQFPHPRNRLDVQQLQTTGLQQPCIFIGVVIAGPANRGHFRHFTFCEPIQKLIHVPVVIHCNLFESLDSGGSAFLEISENLAAPLLLLLVDLMSVQRESCINSDKNDGQFNKAINDQTCPRVRR